MQDTPNTFDTPLAGLDKAEWLNRLADIADERGHFQPLGQKHLAAFVDAGATLLVSFESIQGIRTLSDTAQPLGWELTRALGWSSLSVISEGDTWFRDPAVYGYFDALIDDGFFDEFDNIIFYGAGPCGYAAAAFSVAAPGATVLAIQPQATLDPRVTEWDERFVEMRRTSFTDRYGYAPDMLDAASHAYVIYDPQVELDAMHAALFTRPNVQKFRLRFMGSTIQTELLEMQLLFPLLARAGSDKLNTTNFARLMRHRREYPPYLRAVLAHVDRQDRPWLATMICRNVLKRFDHAPRFSRRLKQLEREARDGGVVIPPERL
ncbi:phosphoadenosine phosphosulfate reductase [Alisedimentitalea sp. MJ-SS2]|uniref:phosphoadenosine phosphosulfate reductase n=1 Tax=Aliisedimentitalea sp. MJ-SS2 TaxID=3049795 RepID=UPI00290795BF|nr:phosphoadenosine phosphosulfate reductase [Alisedimentitalea sp. MJ-SS2]MDU8926684.1 phosphoadenosine phosphosulfate reductase [Alisedimentitalea sp. MJ-SS2]